jgi:hypothetical protein
MTKKKTKKTKNQRLRGTGLSNGIEYDPESEDEILSLIPKKVDTPERLALVLRESLWPASKKVEAALDRLTAPRGPGFKNGISSMDGYDKEPSFVIHYKDHSFRVTVTEDHAARADYVKRG